MLSGHLDSLMISNLQLSRVELIETLKTLITRTEGRMLRPRLLTNVNGFEPIAPQVTAAVGSPLVPTHDIERTTLPPRSPSKVAIATSLDDTPTTSDVVSSTVCLNIPLMSHQHLFLDPRRPRCRHC